MFRPLAEPSVAVTALEADRRRKNPRQILLAASDLQYLYISYRALEQRYNSSMYGQSVYENSEGCALVLYGSPGVIHIRFLAL